MNQRKRSEASFDWDAVDAGLSFAEIFNLDEIQPIQDAFAKAMGVAAVITDLEGQPLTKPSNLNPAHEAVLCRSSKGLTDCMRQVATSDAPKLDGSLIQPCLDVGFLDAGIGIFFGERHVANWLIGQVLRDDFDEQHLAAYIKKFEVDEESLRAAIAQIPRMSTEHFQQLGQALHLMARELAQHQKDAARWQLRETYFISRNALLKTIFEQMETSLIVMSSDMVVRSINPACGKMLGVEDESSFVGQAWTEIEVTWEELYPDGTILPMAEKPLAKALQGVETHDFKYIIKRADGSSVWVTIQGIPLYNSAGEVVAGAVVFSDITEHKLLEQEIQDNAKMVRGLVSSVPGAVFQFKLEPDGQRSFPFISDRWEELFGISKEDALRDADLSFAVIHPEDLSKVEDAIAVSVQTLVPWELEFCLRVAGVDKWVSGKAIPAPQPDGSLVWSGLLIDITASRRAEEERERLQREIIESQRHALDELSTPIIPIMDQIIVMPLIGGVDSMRAKDIMRSLLAGIREHHAKVVILDVTGVPVVDTGVVNYLNKTVQAARLKGARTIITGISDAVAETVVDLGIDWSQIETLRDLQSGLLVALRSLGLKLQR